MENAINAVSKLIGSSADSPTHDHDQTEVKTASNGGRGTKRSKVTKGGKVTKAAKVAKGKKVTQKSSSHSSVSVSSGSDIDETIDREVTPAIEHEHTIRQHETREQTFVHKEKHQDIYHTTVQPLTTSEVLPEKHDHSSEIELRKVNHDDGAAKAKAEADRAAMISIGGEQDKEEEEEEEEEHVESKTLEPTHVEEHVHYHLHETIQPVIEKGKLNGQHFGALC